MIVCDADYHDALMAMIKLLREKHPDWGGARIHLRAKIEVAKIRRDR